jgi:iron complex transport system permease protein
MSRAVRAILLSAVALVLAGVLRLLAADHAIAWPESRAILDIRLERIAVGTLVGAALGLSGVMLQALLRNPLASPDLLGLASGAGFGVLLSYYAGYLAGMGASPLFGRTGPAVAGSLVALALVYLLSQRRGVVEPVSLILIGVMVAILAGAGTQLVRHLLPGQGLQASRWLVGALPDDLAPVEFFGAGFIVVCGLVGAIALGPAMDALALSDDEAASVGVRRARVRAFLFLLAGLLAAASVVLAGPIGFVGLVCPHLARMLSGPSHRTLAVAASLSGAALIVFADALVRFLPTPSGRLPIGILTTVIGGPLFVVLLRRELARGTMDRW